MRLFIVEKFFCKKWRKSNGEQDGEAQIIHGIFESD